MSELADALQIIVVAGKAAIWIGKAPFKIGMKVAKVWNTVNLAKWNGNTSLNRLRQIKGDNLVFINASTEDKKTLGQIENEMKQHGILFARMPDLCGGDGRTQYAISQSDMGKFKAFQLDHFDGKYKNVLIGPISAADYSATGYDRNGRETPEMQRLNQSARETLREQQQRASSPQMQGQNRGYASARQQANRPGDNMRARSGSEYSANYAQQRQGQPGQASGARQMGYPEMPGTADRADGNNRNAFNSGTFEMNGARYRTNGNVRYSIARHDSMVAEQGDTAWIFQEPFERNENWSLFEMPDGRRAVVVPDKDVFELTGGSGSRYRTALYHNQDYNIIDMATGIVYQEKGIEVEEAMRMPNVRARNTELKNTARNMGMDADAILENNSRASVRDVAQGFPEHDPNLANASRNDISQGISVPREMRMDPVRGDPFRIQDGRREDIRMEGNPGFKDERTFSQELVFPREKFADMEEVTGRKTYYTELPGGKSGSYVEFPKEDCHFSEDGESLIVGIRDEGSYRTFGAQKNSEKSFYGASRMSGAELRKEIGGDALTKVEEDLVKGIPGEKYHVPGTEEIPKRENSQMEAPEMETVETFRSKNVVIPGGERPEYGTGLSEHSSTNLQGNAPDYKEEERMMGDAFQPNVDRISNKAAPDFSGKIARRPTVEQEDTFLNFSSGCFGVYQKNEQGGLDFVYTDKISNVGSASLSNLKKLFHDGGPGASVGRPLATGDIIVVSNQDGPQAFCINSNLKLERQPNFIEKRKSMLPSSIDGKDKKSAVKRVRPLKHHFPFGNSRR